MSKLASAEERYVKTETLKFVVDMIEDMMDKQGKDVKASKVLGLLKIALLITDGAETKEESMERLQELKKKAQEED